MSLTVSRDLSCSPARRLPALGLLLLPLLMLTLSACSSSARAERAWERGKELWEDGKEDEATRILERGLRDDEDLHGMRLTLARIYYEKGERPHLEQRRLLAQAEVAYGRNDAKLGRSLETRAEQSKLDAAVHYGIAAGHLDVIIDGAADPPVIAHAAYLRMRIAIFTENWVMARKAADVAIEKGGIKGTPREAKFRKFLDLIDRKPKPLMPAPGS